MNANGPRSNDVKYSNDVYDDVRLGGAGGLLQSFYRGLPTGLRSGMAPLAQRVRRWFDSDLRAHEKWLANDYSRFGVAIRERIFLSIARFCQINRPIEGYYFEFGSHSARTMRLCWKHTHRLFNWTYVAFDSFEGLPEIAEIDRQKIWAKGRLKTGEEEFIAKVAAVGMDRDRLITVKGFYDQTLTPELQQRFLPTRAAAIYVDCDLYLSTVPVLKFIKPFLQPGTIIVFDDWNCFIGDSQKGERLAWAEFTAANPQLKFEQFVSDGETNSFIFVGER
jgi:hypothetical protein